MIRASRSPNIGLQTFSPLVFTLVLGVLGAFPDSAAGQGLAITPSAGFNVSWDGNDGDFFDEAPSAEAPDNLALASNGGVAFSNGESQFFPTHAIAHLNNGFYGNSNNSHIVGTGGSAPHFMGIALPAAAELTAIAWGRDNGNGNFDDSSAGTDACGGQCDDRWQGVYEVQITTVADPDETTSDADWTTIATLEYLSSEDIEPGNGFTPWLRHQYAISTDTNDPISATGVRILVPNQDICIDEIELYADTVPTPTLRPVEEGGEIEAGNLAATGTPFAKDVQAGRSVDSLNDEVPGDGSAWAGSTMDSFAGISLGADPVPVRSVAFGRDNTGEETDQALGTYTLQFTNVANPDESTPDGDWISIGEITYEAGDPAGPHLRHRFNFGERQATGLRLLTPDGAVIDEFEIYQDIYSPPPPPALTITPSAGFTATWDGNDGDFFDPEPSAPAPDNLGLATNGSVPFSNGESQFFPTHAIEWLNNGFYGNSNNSHIVGNGGSAPHFMGIALPGPTALTAVAWGRDNGNGNFDDNPAGTDACGGQCDDRSVGTYTLQFTTVPDPDETTAEDDWTTIAEFVYVGDADKTDNEPGGLFTEWLRHQYEIGVAGGGPIVATGIRIVLSDAQIAIDEIELYGVVAPPVGPGLDVAYDATAGELTLTWDSEDGRLYNVRSETDLAAGEPIGWSIFNGLQDLEATPPQNSVSFAFPDEAERFFVVEEFPAPPEEVFNDDFESGQGGWTVGSDRLAGTDWELGAPANVGPPSANSGTSAFGTNIDDNYANDAEVWLRSPAIDLTSAAGATLRFFQFYDIEEMFDAGTVRILDAADDSLIDEIVSGVEGTSADWEEATESLPAAALGKMIKIEFRFTSDDFNGVPQAGWYVDDVVVTVP